MNSELRDFIEATFGSIWTLETLLVLMEAPERPWSTRELTDYLRSSDAVVIEATAHLVRSGLARHNAEGAILYEPGSPRLKGLATSLKAEFLRAPVAVRRMIVATRASDPKAFSDNFNAGAD